MKKLAGEDDYIIFEISLNIGDDPKKFIKVLDSIRTDASSPVIAKGYRVAGGTIHDATLGYLVILIEEQDYKKILSYLDEVPGMKKFLPYDGLAKNCVNSAKKLQVIKILKE